MPAPRPADTMSDPKASDSDIDAFARAAEPGGDPEDRLAVPAWERAQWLELLSRATPLELLPGDALIMPHAAERALYFVMSGRIEVAITSSRDGSLSALGAVAPGSVLGELAFFDGGPRTARAWAVEPTRLLRLSFEQYRRYAGEHGPDAATLVFALARLLAHRLRRLTARL